MSLADTIAKIASRQVTRRGMPWLGALLIGVIAALAAFDIVRGYRANIEQTGRELETQARIIAEQTARSVQAVDVALRHVAAEFGRGRLAHLSPEELHGYLRDQAVGLVQIDGFVMHDAAGDALAVSWLAPRAVVNIAQLPGFRALRDDPSIDLGVSPAVRSPTDQKWMIPIGRRLETPAGEFGGLVGARGRIEYFQHFYRDIQLDRGTKVTLMHGNGTLLARHPPDEAALGQRFPLFDEMLASLASTRPGPLRVTSPIDGVERFGTVRLVPDYPLGVIVTRDVAVALAPWRAQALGTALRTLALGALAALLLAGLQRQIARLGAARESLETSQERFALAVAGSDDGIWDWDQATRMLFASARARELFGLPPGPETVPMDEWFASMQWHPDDRPLRQQAIDDHLSGRKPSYEGEYRVRHADGKYRWVRVRGLCVRDAAGKPQRMAGSVSDIDARRRAEEALRESEERMALAVAGSNDGIVYWDIEHDRMYSSERAMRIVGIESECTSRTRAEWLALLEFHPDDGPRHAADLSQHMEGKVPVREGEYRLLHPDGRYRWVRVRGIFVRDASGRPLRWAGSVSDIDAQRRAEDALRESEARYATAMTGSNEGHWVWEIASDELFVSPMLRELFDLPPEAKVTTRASFFDQVAIHADDYARLQKVDAEHLAGLTPRIEIEFRIVPRAAGPVRWLHSRGQCFRDAEGRPLRVAGATIDISERKRTEQALRESEERFALAVAGSDDGVWVWDFIAGTAFESTRARELQGLPPGPELQPLPDLLESLRVHPDDAPRRAEAIRAHLEGEKAAYECEYRVRHDDGNCRWVRIHALCIRDAGGKPVRMAGSVSDIDARKRAEEALRGSEQRFALAVAGSNDGILDWDIVNDRMFASDRLMRMVGLEPDNVLRTRAEWSALVMPRFHPDDARRVLAELRGEHGKPADAHDGEYRARGYDGHYRWMRFRGRTVRDANGRAIRWAGSVSDIDAQKRTEEALRESEQRYQLAVAGSNQGLWDWDIASDTVFFSARAQQLIGDEPGPSRRSRREWLDRWACHPDDLPRVRQALADYLHGSGKLWEIEYRLRHGSGTWHWYRDRGVALRDESGRPYRMAGSLEDITDRKNAEAERVRLEGQLRQSQKLEAMGTLAGGIAHDFNNILAAILGYGEMAQKDALEGGTQRRHIDAALSAAMRAKSLVERILAFSRSGMSERVPVHVESVVAEALDAVAASLPSGVRLESELAAGDAAVLGDATQIHQVVMNLCANAVQSMKSAGALALALQTVQFDSPRCVHSAQLPAGSYVRLSVRDSGSGIAPQLLERIFDPFFTTKQVGVGTGLGLSLVHGIVTDLGGGIDVASEVGVGSTFTVYLPWGSCVAAPQTLEEPVANGDGETILIVDDEEPLVRLGEEMTAELGYEPVGFASSAAALEAFRIDPGRFDIVLSDEAMPGLTGSELAREIRCIRPDIPIVLMTGYVTPTLTARARDIGIDEVLLKPLVSRDIARSLAGALRRLTSDAPH